MGECYKLFVIFPKFSKSFFFYRINTKKKKVGIAASHFPEKKIKKVNFTCTMFHVNKKKTQTYRFTNISYWHIVFCFLHRSHVVVVVLHFALKKKKLGVWYLAFFLFKYVCVVYVHNFTCGFCFML